MIKANYDMQEPALAHSTLKTYKIHEMTPKVYKSTLL